MLRRFGVCACLLSPHAPSVVRVKPAAQASHRKELHESQLAGQLVQSPTSSYVLGGQVATTRRAIWFGWGQPAARPPLASCRTCQSSSTAAALCLRCIPHNPLACGFTRAMTTALTAGALIQSKVCVAHGAVGGGRALGAVGAAGGADAVCGDKHSAGARSCVAQKMHIQHIRGVSTWGAAASEVPQFGCRCPAALLHLGSPPCRPPARAGLPAGSARMRSCPAKTQPVTSAAAPTSDLQARLADRAAAGGRVGPTAPARVAAI